MHTLLTLSSVLIVILASLLVLRQLPHSHGWSDRRGVQLAILAVPIVSLSLALAALVHFIDRACFLSTLAWDYALSLALPLLMGLVALGSLALGLFRLSLPRRLIFSDSTPASPARQATVDRLAARLEIASPPLLLCPADRPVALTWGLRRPVVLLSTWMLQHLDAREVEAVLAHELSHIARRDSLVIWLATVLRDAFWYVPTSRLAYRQLQQEKEMASDELAARTTRRPLALASALAKVWQHAVERSALALAPGLMGTGEAIEARIIRLLDRPAAPPSPVPPRSILLGGMAALLGLVLLELALLAALLAPMGCGPAARLL